MHRLSGRYGWLFCLCAVLLLSVLPCFAESSPPVRIDAADTAWVLMSTALVMLWSYRATPLEAR